MKEFLLKAFEVEDEEYMFVNRFQIKVINSREKVEFSEETLTEQQRMSIALGIATLDDFKPKGNVYGNKISYLQIIKPTLTDEFANGSLQAFAMEDLATFMIGTNDDESDIKQEDVKKEETDPVNQDLFGGLFG